NTAFNDLLDSARLQIDRGKARWRRDNQLLTVRRVSILMKIQTLTTGFVRQTHHAMTRVRIDPFARHFCLLGQRSLPQEGAKCASNHQKSLCASLWQQDFSS